MLCSVKNVLRFVLLPWLRTMRWLAEHMLYTWNHFSRGIKKYIAAAFFTFGKTNLANDFITLAGMESNNRHDIAWMKFEPTKTLCYQSWIRIFSGCTRNSMKKKSECNVNTSFKLHFSQICFMMTVNVWWEGIDGESKHLIDWNKKDWHLKSESCSTFYSRFTAPAVNSVIDGGKTRKACHFCILIGGRRPHVIPL